MSIKSLPLKRAVRTALLALLLGAAGMTKGYAYDFSAVCPTGQTLYYDITDATNHYVGLVAPGGTSYSGFTRPTGDIVLPESVQNSGVTYTVTTIDDYAFYYCSGLTGSLTIPNSVTSIGNYAFYGCSGLTGSLTIGNSVTTIGNYAFYNCSGFTGSLTIPNSVTTIGNSAFSGFSGCSGFTGSLTIGNSVTTIGNSAFSGCSGFTGSLTIPNSVTSIGNGAFFGCSGFTGSLTIGNSVTTIGNSAFSGCSGFTGSLTIPSSVTSIGNSAFSGCSGFTGSLTIPSSVTSIGNSAFSNCSGYTEVFYNATNCADADSYSSPFKGCSGTLVIGNNVERIPSNMFSRGGFTGSLTIPNSVTSIGNGAFYYCSGLTGSLTIPNSVTSIGYTAFCGCSGFTGNLIIPNSVTTINGSVFQLCSGLTGSLTIPNSVTSIGGMAFYGCSGFTGSLTIPNSVTSIGSDAFSGCSFIGLDIDMINIPDNFRGKGGTYSGSLTIGNSVTTIGNSAFSGCSGFTGSLTIPNSVTTIGNSAFSGCSGFTGSLTIPNSVTTIGNSAFSGCNHISVIISFAETPPSCGNDAFGSWIASPIVYVPCGFSEAYSSISWGGFNNFYGLCQGSVTVVADPENGGTVSGGGTFEGGEQCTVTATANDGYTFEHWELDGVWVSSDVEYAFIVGGDMVLTAHFVSDDNIVFADANVKSICIAHWDTNGDGELGYEEAASVTSLGNYFRNNKQITSFEELQYFVGLSSIGSYEFYGCSNLGSLTIPNSVTSIGGMAFYGCSGLVGVSYTGSIGQWCTISFSSQSNPLNYAHNLYVDNVLVTDLVIPEGVTEIKSYAFYGATCLTSLTLPNSLTTIGQDAFSGCSGLTGVYYEGSIGQWCTISFSSQSNPLNYAHNLYVDNVLVTDLVIPEGVTEIKSYAFYGATCLTSLTLPNSVTSIGGLAFYGCSGLTGNLTIGNSVTTIGYYAFYGATSLTSLTLPNSVTSIESDAFGDCSGLVGVSYTGSIGQWCTISFSSQSNPLNYAHNLYVDNVLVTDLVIPEGVTEIKSYAFYGATCLTSLTLPNSLTTIGYDAFYGCSGLMGDLVIPNSVTEIGAGAFSGCSGLTGSLTIGNSMETLDLTCFENCNFTGRLTIGSSVTTIYDINYGWEYKQSRQNWGFTEIHSKNATPPVFNTEYPYYGKPENSEYEVLNGVSRSVPVYVPCGATEAYSNADVWSEFTNYQEIPASIVVKSNSENLGYAEIIQYGTCENPESIVEAYPYYSEFTDQSYEFINWTVDGEVVSTNPYYSFELTEDITLVANFGSSYSYVFVGGNSSLWSNAENWLQQELPDEFSTVEILANVYVNGEATVANVNLSYGIVMTIQPEGVLTVTESLNSSSDWEPSVIIEDGGQLYHPNEGVTATVKKTITPYTSGTKNGWHLIANPLSYNAYIYDIENLTSNEYDLYYYDEPSVYWINQEDGNNYYEEMEVGKGYLYGNNQNVTLSFSGYLQNGSATVNVPLSYTTGHALQGFNLVGNPFAHNVTSYASENVANGCYVMNEAKDDLIVSEISEENPLKPAEGFFVKATAAGASITFNPGRGSTATQSGTIRVELVENDKLIDRLLVKTAEGQPLEKFSLNERRTRLFAQGERQELAIVPCEGNEQAVNFKAAKNGQYTISVNADGMDFSYLHLIDNLTGADVDLLAEPSYTFDAKTSDYASRFLLRFIPKDGSSTSSETFAFISNGNIIITEADTNSTLQIVDVTGRVVVSSDAARNVSTSGMSAGVYVLRLINGNDVRTQKIVVE